MFLEERMDVSCKRTKRVIFYTGIKFQNGCLDQIST